MTTTRPLIAVTVGRQNQATRQGERQAITTGCNIDYVSAILRAGGAPVLVPCIADTEAVARVIDACDGLVLTGGGDVVSLAYHEEPHERSKYQDPVRDEMEFAAARAALERGTPTLAICRGMQVLNVVLGGTLIQDIPSQVPHAVKHYSEGLHTVLLHTVEVDDGSLLSRLMDGAREMSINTWHHQAVKDVGAGLRINCRARDGVAEGMESADGGRPILAVQFHPEECAATYPRFQRFFDWLTDEANRFRRDGRSDGRSGDGLPTRATPTPVTEAAEQMADR
jgi:putative glutamine amidotransferase